MFTKIAPFSQATPGIASLETFLSLGLHLVKEHVLDVKTLIKALTVGPMNSYNMEHSGLAPKAQADICIVDPSE